MTLVPWYWNGTEIRKSADPNSGCIIMAARSRDTAAIVSAVNNTYGQNINPEVIVELRDAAQALINYHKSMPLFDSWTNTGGHWASDDLKEVVTALYAALEKSKII